ncbi:MAG: glycolate oxidase subunit GlcF [Candidatus Protistobacter heckmanni]|nr:glycolate oxidase subunit GlcF [Candidatus Protistobacter heckmanni]
MQTQLADFIRDTPQGKEAEAILCKCVHCGFCTATCPTYQLLGDELDGPRGRIYLIKQFLEGRGATEKTQTHLDRCLTCRNCESTCPSGVQYGRLADIGRQLVEQHVERPASQKLLRWTLKKGLSNGPLFSLAMGLGRSVRPLLPAALKAKVPVRRDPGARPEARHGRRMLVLEGCVQPAMSPGINAATARVLDRLGVSLVAAPQAGCCGAIPYHLSDVPAGLDMMRRNIDAWWPMIESAEVIVMTASGCGAMVKEYGHLLAGDPAYAAKAARITAMTKDLSEVLPAFSEQLVALAGSKPRGKVAWHSPCTLQHGQQIRGKVEALLGALGAEVKLCADSHLCCGSAGTYSVLQSELSYKLRDQKLAALDATGAEVIASANIGCLTHLQSGTNKPVRHWIELVDEMTA